MSEQADHGLEWDHRPELRRPVLVAGFEGWNDAADAASDAAAWLTQRYDADRFAWIDPEEHFDFQSRRPAVELVDGVTRTITWPANACFAVRLDGERHDLVVVRGVEPNLRWRSFCRAILDVARETRCELLVTFGALLADVPHTRPMRITGAATDPDLVSQLGLQQSHYEGPTGIVGVLHDAARATGMASASLWAPVPHYVAAPPNPVATRALLDRFGQLIGARLDLGELEQQAGTWRSRVDDVVAGDDDVRAYVHQLEERHDAEPDIAEIPSGEALAAELERFLREQRGDPGD
jgi:proteasome assembly chaperone (PAC2) family protein